MEQTYVESVQFAKARQTIRNKPFLKRVYESFYRRITPRNIPTGPIIELGSGGGFLKEIIPGAITSDIAKAPEIDKIFYAEKIPYRNKSVAAFVMVDVLHHIKDPEKAFREMERCLKINGKIIMVEPYNSLLGKIVYKYIHPENYNPGSKWKIDGKKSPPDSNTALPWIIFIRDNKIFKRKFPNLKIQKAIPHTPFTYLISGGLTKYQFLPGYMYPLAKFIENIFTPLNKLLGIFITVEIQKIRS